FAAIFRVSRAGCSNATSDSIRASLPLLAREAVTLTAGDDQVCTSIAPSKFSMAIVFIPSLNWRVYCASSPVGAGRGIENIGIDTARRIALMIAEDMTTNLPDQNHPCRTVEAHAPSLFASQALFANTQP